MSYFPLQGICERQEVLGLFKRAQHFVQYSELRTCLASLRSSSIGGLGGSNLPSVNWEKEHKERRKREPQVPTHVLSQLNLRNTHMETERLESNSFATIHGHAPQFEDHVVDHPHYYFL